jgi:biopolymer transport protein ExbD
MSTSGGSGVQSTPNVTPMIDVMLVLLVIFMVVTPLINAGFKATPPEGVNLKAHPEEDEDQILGIDINGQYYLNKKPIRNEDLPEALKQIYENRPDNKVLYLKADKGLEYSKILAAIDVAAHSGVRVVGAITDQQPGTASTVPGDVPVKNGNGQPATAP